MEVMTLDKAIQHCQEVAQGQSELYDCYLQHGEQGEHVQNCLKCGTEHRQLAEWLKDYKRLLEQEPCEDAISRQAVRNVLPRQKFIGYEAYLSCIAEIDKLPPVIPQLKTGHWIPVSERLPESSGVYIVTREFNDGFECVDLTDACYFDGTSTWYDDNRINHGREYVDKKIKAWMPLPEPYKAESEE